MFSLEGEDLDEPMNDETSVSGKRTMNSENPFTAKQSTNIPVNLL